MPRIRSVMFGPSPASFENGRTPGCAINENNVVVEVHQGEATDNLFWRIGRVDGVRLSWLDKPGNYGPFGHGNNPSVALNGDVAIVMSDNNQKVEWSIGTLQNIDPGMSNANLGFLVTQAGFPPSPPSTDPSVAVNRAGIVLEVHRQTDTGIYWRRGLQAGQSLEFQSPAQQLSAAGRRPFVAINNSGQAVAVFERGGDLLYSIGTFTPTDTAITSAVSWGAPVPYGHGNRASVALSDDGYVFAMQARGGSKLLQRIGIIKSGAIEWQDVLSVGNEARQFDNGIDPQIAANGKVAVQVHRTESIVSAGLFATASLIFDRANWMGDHTDELLTRTLRQLALPASHDTGAIRNDPARTQDLPIRGQLAYGVRYFDIRPQYTGNKSDSTIDLDKIETYHDVFVVGVEYFPGIPIKEVIADVVAFARDHGELIILKLSHFRNFDQRVFNALQDLMFEQLTDHLFRPPDRKIEARNRFADFPLRLGLKRDENDGVVLIMVDVDANNNMTDYLKTRFLEGFYTYRDWYAPDPENGDFTVFDIFSSTPDFDTMAESTFPDPDHPDVPGEPFLPQGQIPKYGRFDGKCKGSGDVRSTIQCDLFLLSWTVTPNLPATDGTAFVHSAEANRNLVNYLARPELAGRNPQGLAMNLLYTDAVEFSSSVDVAMVRNGFA